ncbi:MAG TPA: PA14 domain-containing protein [Anaerolineae bacterium]|nr:PA14 domain-containing protein [Anaerolineae bacterium]
MDKRVLLLCALTALLLLPGLALAQGPAQPQDSDPSWRAAYWNNTTLTGAPVLERQETNLDHRWGSGSPDALVRAEGFSARWTRYFDLAAGSYRFTTVSDDGLRLYVDGKLLINEWTDHPPKTVAAETSLSAGHHMVTVEFYENMGDATAVVSWAPVSAIQNFRGEYYGNKSLSGSPLLVRDDAKVDFGWGAASPAPGIISADVFSVRWTRTINPGAGNYRFSMTVDDGGRLWVNNHLLIDRWKDQAAQTYTADLYLPAGNVPIKIEYYENMGDAVARLSWSRTDGGASTGGVVVDDTDPGFVKGGSSTGWHTEPEGYGNRLTWTKNNSTIQPNYNWGRWYPKLKAGRYEVLVYIPDRFTTTARARYWISHADGFTLRMVDQSANGDRWVSLGTYSFRGDSNDYVSLSDVTGEPYLSRLIAWDAVKWVGK